MSEPEQQVLNIPQPPDFIFKYRGNRQHPSRVVLEQENSTFILQSVKYPGLADQPKEYYKKWNIDEEKSRPYFNFTPEEKKMGGILAQFQGVPYPSKCFPFPEAVHALNMVKRITIWLIHMFASKALSPSFLGFAFTPRKQKLRAINNFVKYYQATSMMIMGPYYLDDHFYCSAARGTRKLLSVFFKEIGIEMYDQLAEIFAMFIEYDNGYRLRLEDAMSCSTKEQMLANPRKEIQRIVGIIASRELPGKESQSIKYINTGKLLSYVLLLPSIKRAFKKAMEEVDYTDLQLDDADRYHVLLWKDYNFLGKSIEDRLNTYINDIHKGNVPLRVTYKGQ